LCRNLVRVLNSHLCDFITNSVDSAPHSLTNLIYSVFLFYAKDKNMHLNVSTQYVEPYRLGGVVVSVLATGPKGRGFAKSDRFLRAQLP
jgi:hypothetical protein